MINPDTTQFFVRQQVWSNKLDINIKDGKDFVIGFEWGEIEPGMAYGPSLSLEVEEAQQLMDQLYACGIRPSKERGSAGQLDAVKYHLEDMRKLVFK